MPQSIIGAWLEEIGLAQLAPQFVEQQIEMQDLPELSEQDLEKLGIPLGPRKRLMKAIAGLGAFDDRRQSARATRQGVASVTVEGERRQLTVLFCDMVGFTELANRVDPEVLQQIIRSYEDACAVCIARFDGYVFQRLGDGIVAFFGYPLAHEGEAERAVRAALEIIASLSKLELAEVGHLRVRIGIATGLVVVSSAEKGAVGETMNLAARLQAIAPVNGIVVSERVRRVAGGALDYEDLGEQTLKGIAQPTHAYRIVGVSEAATRFDAATGAQVTPLVGREQELGLLLERWQLAQEGEGQVVLLSGEPGIGKSRILSTLRERLEAQGAQALRFQCSPYYVNSALWPSIDNFERALKFSRDESSQSKLDKLEALMVTNYGLPRSDVRFVASMLSIPCEERYGALAMTRQKFKDEMLRTLVDLTEAAARKHPSVMLFEDAHWADPTSLEVMDLLIDRVDGVPMLIVLTHRPEFQSRWSQHGHVAAINLSKLTRAQSTTLVQCLIRGKTLPADVLEQVLAKTDGVPLFVEELTKSILESGELKDQGDRYEYIGAEHAISIPTTLRDSLMARLDRYTPVKEIAQIGAAIGREFDYELIAAVAPLTSVQLDSALAQLTESGLAFRRGTPPDAAYTFKHALVQDAAYDSLLKSRRQALHGKIAQAITQLDLDAVHTAPALLARHHSLAGNAVIAAGLWIKAGAQALERMAVKESIEQLERGLADARTLAPGAERDNLELELRALSGIAWITSKAWAVPEVWEHLHRAYELARNAGRHDRLPSLLWGLALNVLTNGRAQEALEWVDRAFANAESTTVDEHLAIAHAAAILTHFFLGNLMKVQEHALAVLSMYAAGSPDTAKHIQQDAMTIALCQLAHVDWILGYPERSLRTDLQKIEHAKRLARVFDLGFAVGFGSYHFAYRRNGRMLRERADMVYRIGVDSSLPLFSVLDTTQMRGYAEIIDGDSEVGVGSLRAILESPMTPINLRPFTYCMIARGEAQSGALDTALVTVERALEQIERPGWEERCHLAEVLRIKGWILSLRGDADGAQQCYEKSLAWAREQQARSWELRTAMALARLWQSQGKRAQAYDLLAPVYGWFTEGFDTEDLQEAKALLIELKVAL